MEDASDCGASSALQMNSSACCEPEQICSSPNANDRRKIQKQSLTTVCFAPPNSVAIKADLAYCQHPCPSGSSDSVPCKDSQAKDRGSEISKTLPASVHETVAFKQRTFSVPSSQTLNVPVQEPEMLSTETSLRQQVATHGSLDDFFRSSSDKTHVTNEQNINCIHGDHSYSNDVSDSLRLAADQESVCIFFEPASPSKYRHCKLKPPQLHRAHQFSSAATMWVARPFRNDAVAEQRQFVNSQYISYSLPSSPVYTSLNKDVSDGHFPQTLPHGGSWPLL